jgi:hypothetical protein
MSLLTWLRGVTTGPETVRRVPANAGGPLSPRLAQELRIQRKAARYREQLRAEAAARQAREEQEERQRLQRAQDEHEDAVAFGLAMGVGYFPEDRHGAGPRLLSLEEWAAQIQEQQAEAGDWRQGR